MTSSTSRSSSLKNHGPGSKPRTSTTTYLTREVADPENEETRLQVWPGWIPPGSVPLAARSNSTKPASKNFRGREDADDSPSRSYDDLEEIAELGERASQEVYIAVRYSSGTRG